MRGLAVTLGLFAVAIAIFSYIAPGRTSPGAPATQVGAAHGRDAQTALLSAQVEELQRTVGALKAHLATQQGVHAPPQRAATSGDAKAPEIESVEAQRAADAERLHQYMQGVEQAFANEKLDPAWASRAASRVGNTFEGDETLRNIPHTVECRKQTCRLQIEDNDSGRLSARMPFLTLGLADVLPQVSAEHIDQANGRGAMVLYMSSQRMASASR